VHRIQDITSKGCSKRVYRVLCKRGRDQSLDILYSNWMVNRVKAALQSLSGIVYFSLMLFCAR
jgi:hypothetical protein